MGTLVKINLYGVWKQGYGVGGYGAIFPDYRGHVLGAFSSHLEMPSSVDAEVMAVIKAIQLAWVRDWNHIWLEVDSSRLLDFLHFEWHNCLYPLCQISACSLFSHISGRYSSCQCIGEFWYYFGLGLVGVGSSFHL